MWIRRDLTQTEIIDKNLTDEQFFERYDKTPNRYVFKMVADAKGYSVSKYNYAYMKWQQRDYVKFCRQYSQDVR